MEKQELIRLLSLALHDTAVISEPIDFSSCLSQASTHGLANMLYFAANKLPEEQRPDENTQKLLKQMVYACLTSDAIQDREMDELQEQFEKRKLLMLPLKGYVVKNVYPMHGMRTMSDTDILIKSDQASQVKALFEESGYRFSGSNGDGNTDFYDSPVGLHYEIHKDLEPEGARPEDRTFLKNLLSCGVPIRGKQYILRLPPEEHYIYLLCHFIKHFLGRGIGIRQVMDIYLCRKKWEINEDRLNSLLDSLKLRPFAEHLERLAFFWFDDGEPDEVTVSMGEYIFNSGVFGNTENWVPNQKLKVKQQKKNYIIHRLFPSYKTMCGYYPSLKKVPILLPFCWCRRIFHAFFCKRKDLKDELSAVKNTDDEALTRKALFYQNCGLNVFESYTKGLKE